MIDTIAFDLPQEVCEITKPFLFEPHADILVNKPADLRDQRIFPKNIMQYDKKIYYPRVSLYEYTHHPPRRIYVKVECSASKLMKGENLLSIRSEDMQKFSLVASGALSEAGVDVTPENILAAGVSTLHVAHNIIVPVPPSIIIGDLARALQRANRDIQKTDFRNGGQILHLHYDEYELVFYDKVADMERLQHSPKRAICYDKFPELPVYKQYLENKNLYVLRIELRLNTTQAVQDHLYPCITDPEELKQMQIKGLRVRDCFNEAFVKEMLLRQWRQVKESLNRLPAFRRNPAELFADIVRWNPHVSKKKLETLIPVVMMLSQIGARETLNSLKALYPEEKAKRKIKEALALNLARYKPNYIEYVDKELHRFTPLTPKLLTRKVNKSIIKLNMDNPEFLTVEEMAGILKVVPMTIYRYLKAGKMPTYRFGKEYRVHKDDFLAFVASCKVSNKKGGLK